MADHVRAVVGRYRGRVDIYDVVNEPLKVFEPGFDTVDSITSRSNVFYNTLGVEYIDEAFGLAHAADPRAKLFLNEIVWDPRLGNPKADFFLELVRDLVARGIDAVAWIKEAAGIVRGGGGGRADLAQAGGKLPEKLDDALDAARRTIETSLGQS